MKQTLYQYALVWHPTAEQVKEGGASKIIQEPKWILAKDHNAVFVQVARLIPDEYIKEVDQVDIQIKSF